jgi:integrase
MARCGVSGFSPHDLRRCCRSLMSRVGVRPDVAERALGHSVGGAVAQTYDRHSYSTEIADALAKLAALIETIVHGDPGSKNVVPLRAGAVQP